MNRSWIFIIVGALIEVVWVIGFKHAHDFITWLITVIALLVSFSLIITASRKLPVGTVYAVFTGLGTAGTVLTEMLVFGEPVKLLKLVLIVVLLCGVIGLKLIGNKQQLKEVSH